MRKIIAALMVLVVGGTYVALAATDDPPMDPSVKFKLFKPAQEVEQMMHGQEKLYGDLKDGIIDKAWDEVQVSAWLLAELANVNHFQSTDPKYQKFADEMSAECIKVAKIAKKRDVRTTRVAVSRLGKRCKACHEVFRKDEDEEHEEHEHEHESGR